jgi:hypothetical protein
MYQYRMALTTYENSPSAADATPMLLTALVLPGLALLFSKNQKVENAHEELRNITRCFTITGTTRL